MSRSKIISKPKRSSGSLYVRKDYEPWVWVARFAVHERLVDGRIRARRKSAVLGSFDELTRDQAAELMRRKIVLARRTYESLAASEVNSSHQWFIKNPLVRGAAAELLVAVDLMRAGLQVYRNLNATGTCDLVAEVDHHFVRVEVKVGTLDASGVPIVETARQVGKFDVLAVVGPDRAVHYFTPDLSRIHFANPILSVAHVTNGHVKNEAESGSRETANSADGGSL
jgi:hypothetical protein